MSAGILFEAIIDFVSSVPLDPTSTVCAIALLVVASLTWRHILVRGPTRAPRRQPRRAHATAHHLRRPPTP